MPEQLTQHPEATMQVLRSAGARCGSAEPGVTLKSCPAERLCKLPDGEICVYGVGDAARMSELGAADWRALAQAGAGSGPSSPAAGWTQTEAFAFGLALLMLGLLIGWVMPRRR